MPNVGPAPTAAQSAATLAARNAQVAQETLARNGQPYVPQPLVTNVQGGNQTFDSPAGPVNNSAMAQQFGTGTGVYAQTPLPAGITNQAQYQQYLEEQRRQAWQSEFNAAQAQYDQQRRFVPQYQPAGLLGPVNVRQEPQLQNNQQWPGGVAPTMSFTPYQPQLQNNQQWPGGVAPQPQLQNNQQWLGGVAPQPQQELAKQGVNQAPLRQPAPSNQQRPPLFPGWGRR